MKLRSTLLACAAALSLGACASTMSQTAPVPFQAAPALSQAAPAWPHAASDLPVDPAVRFGTLPNGMRYAIRRNATPPGEASLRLRIDAGSLHEAEDQRGLAHFLEHMVLNGTTNVPEGEFVRMLERHGLRFGPDTNASTDFGQTLYKLDLPETDAETIDTALFLLREVADEATLVAAAIESERGIIQSEERTRATPPMRVLIDQLAFLMPGQLLPTRIPIGDPEVVATAPRERFVAFYNAYYRPERATLVAVGDFDVDEMEAKIRARFSGWRGEGPAGADPDLGRPAQRGGEARVMVAAGAPGQLILNWVRPPDLRPDTRATRIDKLADALALQILSRRLERIAATQSPPPFVASMAVSATLYDTIDATQLVAIPRPGEWRAALAAAEAEQRRLVEQGATPAELARELGQLRAALTAQAAGAATRPSSDLAESIVASIEADDVLTAPAANLALLESAAAELDVERVNAAARALFAGEALLYMSSPTPVEGGEQALLAAYRESRGTALAAGAAQQAQTWPYTSFGAPGAVAERRELPAAVGATAVRFENGVRLTVKQTAFTDDQVLVAVRAGHGRAGLPTDRPNPEWGLPLAFATLGTARMSSEDMQEALAARTYGVSLTPGDDAFQIIGTTRPEDFALQMQVLTAYVGDPGWRESGWERLRAFSGNIHDALASTPDGVFNRDAGALLRSGDRRWVVPTREEMNASNVADVRAVLGRAFAQGPIEVIVVGDIGVEEAIRQTAATFGALPPRPGTPEPQGVVRFPAPTTEPVRLTHGGRADQALAYIAWPTQDFYADPRQARVLNVLSDVFRLRLNQRIREEQGTTYSPQAGHNASEAFAGYGLFSAQIEARPETLDGFLRDAQDIAGDLAQAPISADELQRALRPRVEGLQRQMTNNAWWLANLANVQEDPRVAASLARLLDEYRAITPADLQRAARQFLRPDRAYRIVVLPGEGAPAS